MDHGFVRKIEFVIPSSGKSPGLKVLATEVDGDLVFELEVLEGFVHRGDLRALFLDFNRPDLLDGLMSSGGDVSDFDTGSVSNLGQGANVRGQAQPYHLGVEFGSPGVAKDKITKTAFSLSHEDYDLSLDDIANVEFGARINGLAGGASKLSVLAPAAPDAVADDYAIFEESVDSLNEPSTVRAGTVFDLLDNDTDADGDTLTIIDFSAPAHGDIEIIDGDDADDLIGDAVLYTPDEDYSGSDSFYYLVDDNNGGTDFAQVTVNIEAVADIPDLSYEILEGAIVNQVVVRVTTAQTDFDGSEYIDRIELDGIPEGVAVSEQVYNPETEDGQMVRDFVLTLPRYEDSNFDLSITSVAKELSNGDEEIASEKVAIVYDENLNHFDPLFVVDNHSMWGSGDAWSFSDDRFLGVDSVASGSTGSTFYADYFLDYKFGFQSTLNIGNGEVDASVPYEVDVQTLYNETTDWLRFETDASVVLADSVFSTQSPLLTYGLDLIAELQSAVTFGVDVSFAGTSAVKVAGQTIIPAIPGWSFGGSENVNFGFNASPTLLEFDGDSLNLFGLQGDSALNIDLTPDGSLYLTAEIPHFTTNSSVAGDHLESSGSDNFLTLNADIDQLVSTLLGLPVNPFGDSVSFGPVEVGYDLLNYVVSGAMGVGQEFDLSFGNLNGTLVFEDGYEQSFVLGEDLNIFNASSHDSNGDGDLDFDLELSPDATFSSNLLLTLELAHQLDLLDAYAKVSVPAFDDPEYHLGPVSSYSDTLASTSIDVVGLPSFSFDLGNNTELFIV